MPVLWGRRSWVNNMNKAGGPVVRFGIIGTNFITQRLLSAAALCEDFALTTVYSRSLQKARDFAREWGAPLALDSLDALAQSSQVDAVYIASPNCCHADQAVVLLGGGKHVLCEKPVAIDSPQLQQMLKAAQQADRVLLEAMRSAHLPALDALRAAMQKIGPVRRAQISYCQYSSRYDKFKQGIIENAFDPTLGNGALMDIGVYCVHLMVMLFGMPRDICAKGWFLPRSIDAYGNAICCYDGMQVQLAYSKIHQSNSPGEIQGEQGTVFFTPTATPSSIWVEYNDGRREDIPLRQEPQDMVYELRRFIRLIQTGEPPNRWQAYSVQSMQILDEMRRQIGINFTTR